MEAHASGWIVSNLISLDCYQRIPRASLRLIGYSYIRIIIDLVILDKNVRRVNQDDPLNIFENRIPQNGGIDAIDL